MKKKVSTDIGGTFTDLVYIDDNGFINFEKSPTTPPNFEQGVLNVLEDVGLKGEDIETFIHGSTVIINTLTERTGVKTGLITTKGFRDVLEIARGNRPDLFNIRYKKPEPFIPRYLRKEVNERLNQRGDIITPLKKQEVEEIVDFFKKQEVEAIAIMFLHSYKNPKHESMVKNWIKKIWPQVFVTASHEITKEWREYERTNTSVLNSYVKPIAARYIDSLSDGLKNLNMRSNNYIMQSNGGSTTFSKAKELPINMVESGPVSGVYGAATLGKHIGEENIIAFDIGGTTAKCSLIENGEVSVSTDYFIERDELNAGYPIKVPVIDIVEIGNGGGSIAWIDDTSSLRVGPKSAGAKPGPVAYSLGGTLPTLTDANLLTGRLSLDNFKNKGSIEKVKEAIFDQIAKPFNTTAEKAALGIIRIANSNMLNALKLISIRKGHDPRNFSLVAFGGAGSLHAPGLAKELGIKKVIVPVATSVFSAWGMLMSDLRKDYVETYTNKIVNAEVTYLNEKWSSMEKQAVNQLEEEGTNKGKITFHRFLDIRYVGQEHTVKVPAPLNDWSESTKDIIAKTFHELHEKNYSFHLPDAQTEIVSFHLTAFGEVDKPQLKKIISDRKVELAIKEKRNVLFESEGWRQTTVYNRELLPVGKKVIGPAIIEESTASTIIHPNMTLLIDEYGNLIIDTGVKLYDKN